MKLFYAYWLEDFIYQLTKKYYFAVYGPPFTDKFLRTLDVLCRRNPWLRGTGLGKSSDSWSLVLLLLL